MRRRWAFPQQQAKRKFGNKPTEVDGWKFASKDEAERYRQLKLLKISGEIVHFDIHPAFHLAPGVRYTADFTVYYHDGTIEVEDVKGSRATATKDFVIRRTLFNNQHPFAPLKIVTNP